MAPRTYAPIPEMTDEEKARFWSKVDRSGKCWVWTKSQNKQGYGSYAIKRKPYRTHRVSYAMAFGDPGHNLVCHTCDNPSCVRPQHLFLGTQVSNMADMVAKGRSPRSAIGDPRGLARENLEKTECKRGHPFDEENTYHNGGRRHCRSCRRERKKVS